MTPPISAQTLVALCTPPHDYESVLGDLHEEYIRRGKRDGRASADAWYWSQTIASIPSLLSYSRAHRSAGATFVTMLLLLLAILAMAFANELIDDGIRSVYHTTRGIGAWPFFVAGWLDAACFGALIAALRRSYGMRFMLIAASALVAFVAVPIALRVSSPLTPANWVLVLGGAVSIIVGGAAYHLGRVHFALRRI